jgi:hypothetical protein
MALKAFDSMGQEVKPGDIILSFRDEKVEFIKATRARDDYRSGKVVVQRVEGKHQMEYYDRVFDLHVKDLPE